MILVAGATGLVGMEVCRQLLAQNQEVRALARYSSDAEKLQALRDMGAETCYGNLRDYTSLRRACQGIETVISTASSTRSRQEGDTIESVDRHGQLTLVDSARLEGVGHFVFLSFPDDPGIQFPLTRAKRAVAAAIQETGMDYTIFESCWFMEIWLSPAVGFDYDNAEARIYGDGTKPLSWISSYDVAKFLVAAVNEPTMRNQVIRIGGPQALTPQEVVSIFEEVGGAPFNVDYVPADGLRTQMDTTADPLEASYSGLMLQYAGGVEMDMTEWLARLPMKMTTVGDYAARVVAKKPLMAV